MAFDCHYAGQRFLTDDPRLLEWVAERIPLRDLRETLSPPDGASLLSRSLPGIALPRWPERPDLRINDFFYPTGASRWCEFHGLMDAPRVDAVLAATVGTAAGTSQGAMVGGSFVMQNPAFPADAAGLQTTMYMLPPRELTAWGVAPDAKKVYLVSLVCERYFLQYQTCEAVHLASSDTWASLLSLLNGKLKGGLSLSYDAPESVYGGPNQDSAFWANYESLAALIDAAAHNLGRVVVRQKTGKVLRLMKPAEAATIRDAQWRPLTDHRLAGADALRRTLAKQAVWPASVTVTFPKYKTETGWVDTRDCDSWIKDSYGDVHTVTNTIAQLGLDPGGVGTTGTKIIRDTARAYYNAANDLLNESPLNLLAAQLGRDYYAWLTSGVDEVYPGIRLWAPEGIHDVLYRWNGVVATTRVQCRPWNFGVEEMQHGFPVASGVTLKCPGDLLLLVGSQDQTVCNPANSLVFDNQTGMRVGVLSTLTSNTNPATFNSVGHDFITGDVVYVLPADDGFPSNTSTIDANTPTYTVTRLNADNFRVNAAIGFSTGSRCLVAKKSGWVRIGVNDATSTRWGVVSTDNQNVGAGTKAFKDKAYVGNLHDASAFSAPTVVLGEPGFTPPAQGVYRFQVVAQSPSAYGGETFHGFYHEYGGAEFRIMETPASPNSPGYRRLHVGISRLPDYNYSLNSGRVKIWPELIVGVTRPVSAGSQSEIYDTAVVIGDPIGPSGTAGSSASGLVLQYILDGVRQFGLAASSNSYPGQFSGLGSAPYLGMSVNPRVGSVNFPVLVVDEAGVHLRAYVSLGTTGPAYWVHEGGTNHKGKTGTFNPNSLTSMTVKGGIITDWS